MCDFRREHHEQYFCVIILNVGPVVQENKFKDVSFFSSGGHLVEWSGTICAIFSCLHKPDTNQSQ